MTSRTGLDAHDVIIAGDGTAVDQAVLALVEKCGYRATVVTTYAELGARHTPGVVVFRDEIQLARVVRALPSTNAVLVGIGAPARWKTVRGRTVHWLTGRQAVNGLGRILHATLGSAGPVRDRVHITPREREVLRTYLLGSTVAETAAEHGICHSTVKAHYRRVANRYLLADRPVNNRVQLLLEMVADGWIKHRSVPGSAVPDADLMHDDATDADMASVDATSEMDSEALDDYGRRLPAPAVG